MKQHSPPETAEQPPREINVGTKQRRPYEQPRILSAERLEAAAATCDGSGGFGKSAPACNPVYLGS